MKYKFLKSKKEEDNNYIYFILLFLIFLVGVLFTLWKYNLYLPSDNIHVSTEDSDLDWDKTQKVIVTVVDIEVDSYSFDGGINWQKENEYLVSKDEKLVIVIRDVNGTESKPIEYVVDNIDTTPPLINVNLPKAVLLNSKVNLGEYVSVTDDKSGVDGSVIMTPESLDTSTLGVKTINFTAKDKAGNVASIDVTVEVVSQEDKDDESSTKVLYRYRVKNIVEYDCNSYDCSYYEDTDLLPNIEDLITTQCIRPNQVFEFSTSCVITPGASKGGVSCLQALTKTNRYINYYANDGWKYIIDIFALNKNSEQIKFDDLPESGIRLPNAFDNLKPPTSNSDAIKPSNANVSLNTYKKEPCDQFEISINGYCHAICSGKKETGCPDGYILMDHKCKKQVNKTCTETCTKSSWSEWSEWSEIPITSTDLVQVETKVVK